MAYLTIAEAVDRYGRSESTLRRIVRDIRKSADPSRRRLLRPSEREIEENRGNNTSYAYTIAEELIEQELLGKRPGQGSEPAPEQPPPIAIDETLARLEHRYERELARLEKALEREKDEKMQLLKLAHDDKRLFANAADSLGQVLRLPAVAQAVEVARNLRTVDGTAASPGRSEQESEAAPDPEAGDEGDDSAGEGAVPDRTGWLRRWFRRER